MARSRALRLLAVFGAPVAVAATVAVAVALPAPSQSSGDGAEHGEPASAPPSPAAAAAEATPEDALTPRRHARNDGRGGEDGRAEKTRPGTDEGDERGPLWVTLVRAAGALDPGLITAVQASPGVVATTPVRAGQLQLAATTGATGEPIDRFADGWTVPLDVAGVDPAGFSAFLPEAARAPFARLVGPAALLSETGARVRRLGDGATLHLADGTQLTVVGIVPDELVGTAEAVVDAATAADLGLRTQFLLVGTAPGDEEAAGAVAALVAPAPGTLADSAGQAPWPASWREVLPLATVKERFGEFAYRPTGGRWVEQDPQWVAANLVTATVPILGKVRCHRAVIAPLRAALGELDAAGLAHLADPTDYAGCHSPRTMTPGGPVSRHAWGLAVDLNASANPFGAPPQQDPRLIDAMDRHGFGYGGRWPTPDGMHFELRGA